jgi:hypothetical protein
MYRIRPALDRCIASNVNATACLLQVPSGSIRSFANPRTNCLKQSKWLLFPLRYLSYPLHSNLPQSPYSSLYQDHAILPPFFEVRSHGDHKYIEVGRQEFDTMTPGQTHDNIIAPSTTISNAFDSPPSQPSPYKNFTPLGIVQITGEGSETALRMKSFQIPPLMNLPPRVQSIICRLLLLANSEPDEPNRTEGAQE